MNIHCNEQLSFERDNNMYATRNTNKIRKSCRRNRKRKRRSSPVTLWPLLRSESGGPTSEAVRNIVSVAVGAVAAILHAFGVFKVVIGRVILVEKELGVATVGLVSHGGKGKEERMGMRKKEGILGFVSDGI